MTLRFHELAEADHRILNPLSEEKMMFLAEICKIHEATRILDLACGKGEMLCRWAEKYGIAGVGVDLSEVFLEAARLRAKELNVWSKLNFVQGDAAEYPQDFHEFNIVSCIGATWIGGGLVGTLRLMLRALKPDGFLLVGEPYWVETPPREAYAAYNFREDEYLTLDGTLDRFSGEKLELVEMLISTPDDWDRYEAGQWLTLNTWLAQNPDDPDAPAIYEWMARNRRAYLQYGRRYFGWGVFVLRTSA